MSFGSLGRLTGGLIAAVNVVPFAFTIVTYVLTALALYTMAKRRAIAHPWLSWIPVADLWILGSLADQYRYVARGQRRNKRKVLLGVSIAAVVVNVAVFAFAASRAVTMVSDLIYGFMGEGEIFTAIFSMILRSLGVMMLLLPLNILKAVFRYMALYDVYMSCEPENAVMYLVVGIFVGLTEPFFLFIVRERDKGMPPRKEQIHGCGCDRSSQTGAAGYGAPQAAPRTTVYPVPWQDKQQPQAPQTPWQQPAAPAVPLTPEAPEKPLEPQTPEVPADQAPEISTKQPETPAEPESPAP